VILGILFTLALSIVFNARHRGTPLELSSAPADVPAAAHDLDSCTLVPVSSAPLLAAV
jgi:hypothetical protein